MTRLKRNFGIRANAVLFCGLLSVSGCGSSDAKDIVDEESTPKVNISGVSPLMNADVVLSTSSGQQLVMTSTDSAGSFTVTLEMPVSEIVRFDIKVKANSVMICQAARCGMNNAGGAILFGQEIPSQNLENVSFSTYRYITAPAKWHISEEFVSVTLLSTLASQIAFHVINEGAMSAVNTSVATFGSVLNKASEIILRALNLPIKEQINLFSLELPELNEGFLTTAEQDLSVANYALANGVLTSFNNESVMDVSKVLTWMTAMQQSKDIFESSEAIQSLMSLANSHAQRGRNRENLLTVVPRMQAASIPLLVATASTSSDIDVTKLITSMEELNWTVPSSRAANSGRCYESR